MRIDFRELVRDLFGACKARIWMKKINISQPFVPKQFASMALATGVQFSPDAF
jgi:cell fate regulator YaaT (PSP1 superfamily)